VNFAADILLLAGDCDVVGIDEAHSLMNLLWKFCNALANAGKRVICSRADMDFEGRPFGPMPNLLAIRSS